MSSPKKNVIVDPDYEMTEVARERVRLKEDRENKEKIEKIKDVINREFQTEVDHRQSQLELIQQRLNHAQKTLHLLRYVLITSYYIDKDLVVNHPEETSGSNDDSSILNKNRTHPAIKKLLGNNPNDYKFSCTKTPRKKMKYDHQRDSGEKLEKSSGLEALKLNNPVPMEWESANEQVNDSNNKMQQLDDHAQEEFDTGRNRKKSKYRVVVGNISKWMPSKSEEDKSTHKWMVYVRGSKENPDISHFVQKVVFYLHPSYQPNDVVELRETPFHLSRRGWGEFPLRVRIYFQCSLNKPVDIIHNLKLDKTFTGRQTLGNETIVNLFLYDDEKKVEQTNDMDLQITIKKEIDMDVDVSPYESKVNLYDVTQNHAIPNLEHDYCFVGIKQEPLEETIDSPQPSTSGITSQMFAYNCFTEHSYCVSNASQSTSNPLLDSVIKQEQETDLIYGIKDIEQTNNELIEEVVLDDVKIPIKKSVPNSFQRFAISNGTVIAIKKRRRPQESLLKKIFNKKYNSAALERSILLLQNTCNQERTEQPSKLIDPSLLIDYEKYKIDFPSYKFKNVQEALPYLFKRLPLITNLVSDLNYKCTYPYAAKSLQEYSSWNIGKRLSSEWFQAKTILNIISASQLSDCNNWTTKSVIMYARSHGYTPLSDYKIFKNKGDTLKDVLNGRTNIEDAVADLPSEQKVFELNVPEIEVDVINCSPDPESPKTPIHKERLIDHKLELACSYVKQAVLDVGIVSKPEDIIPGVLFNAVERVLLQAALCLAEDLMRKARANLVRHGDFREETSVIGTEEIHKALSERPEFKMLLKSQSED